jgi:large subunit ribosomal protein L21
MNAVIATGGKQYHVKENDLIQVEKIAGEVGDEVKLDRVLMVKDEKGVRFGNPYLEGELVIGRIERQEKGKKIRIIKHRRRKGYRRKQGHRQLFTSLRIVSIGAVKN